jgi:NAD(P)-dependent dehydrogenase (short-subunit alcohol dehydrogenase family)
MRRPALASHNTKVFAYGEYDTFRSMAGVFRDHLLTGKNAFVTGGGSGIGQRMAERFAEHGASVTLAGRKQEKLDAAATRIRSSGGTAATCALDVRDYAAVEAALQKTRDQFGEIDILVCGAAGNFPAPVVGMSANGFKSVIDIDLLGTFNTCRAAYAHLRKPGSSVISISASHATIPIAYQAHVCAAKAGVDLLTRTLAIEWGPEGIRANCITPGPTDDTEGMRRLAPSPEARHRVEQGVPLRRFGTKDELADLALFLCSTAAEYITGAVYVCDGGQSLVRSSLSLTEIQ